MKIYLRRSKVAKRIAVNTLNASTYDIINTIRANASMEYQDSVPVVTDFESFKQVGSILYGYPAFANQFTSALMNRIALVRVNSATFNNAYAELKKGMLEFGETAEEVFVSIAKAREFNPEKAPAREFQRTIPDVKTAFHTMNWRVEYPITIQQEDLRRAFLSETGLQDLIAKIVVSVNTASEYDEFLLFKYMMIKAIAHGKMYPVQVDASVLNDSATKFRGMSNMLTFLKTEYNEAGVHTSTPKSDQYIFMDANFNAKFDVELLSAAFNMDKAEFMGKLKLIDDWTTFDNERFDVIRANSDMIEEVTDAELALCAGVKAVLVDKEWFQIYDNLRTMRETPVNSGLYWNYFYHLWMTVSHSPFSNAVVFTSATVTAPATITGTVTDIIVNNPDSNDAPQNGIVVIDTGNISARHVQTESATEAGIAVHEYGAYVWNTNVADMNDFTAELEYMDERYTCDIEHGEGNTGYLNALALGDTLTFTKVV